MQHLGPCLRRGDVIFFSKLSEFSSFLRQEPKFHALCRRMQHLGPCLRRGDVIFFSKLSEFTSFLRRQESKFHALCQRMQHLVPCLRRGDVIFLPKLSEFSSFLRRQEPKFHALCRRVQHLGPCLRRGDAIFYRNWLITHRSCAGRNPSCMHCADECSSVRKRDAMPAAPLISRRPAASSCRNPPLPRSR